jgi:hypothetical protein
MFEPLLTTKLSTTLINEIWQTYKDNILHQNNKNCLLVLKNGQFIKTSIETYKI